ncbi:transcription factor WhiB [Mycobacteroides abscessus subsp. abscessus]|uniref:WhiB family transcriptional regulator n=1 Tax=Mycobacteroides abscessus TaxID=36809 RepID=UPI0009268300|nr:WhiB family transcriptional regulator [Mycobacteroides abscessus]SIJ20864.1 transcription factor WhiB [Mycobacteroides abscessus subsp. abscessus]SLH39480.1 transcription factor WhiB [Mycobacteroides abscessus subsp. abscessus]
MSSVRRWQSRAQCRSELEAAPELWTSDRTPRKAVRVHLEAVCARCPVARECATAAILSEAQCVFVAGVYVPEPAQRARYAAAMEELSQISCMPVPEVPAEVVEPVRASGGSGDVVQLVLPIAIEELEAVAS